MSRGKYTPEFKAKIVLEVLQGERELGAISAPPTSLNEGVAAVLLHGDILYLATYAQEGLIKQHTAKKIIARLTELVK